MQENKVLKAWFKNKNVVVLGLGKTGTSVVNALVPYAGHVTVNDQQQQAETDMLRQWRERYGVTTIFGQHPDELITDEVDFLIKNPGIRYDHPLVQKATRLSIPVLTDIELAGDATAGTVIGITGSNGKTTTTSLTHAVLTASTLPGTTYLGGNIGIPALESALQATADDRLVWELSSFELAGTRHFHPHIAAITNLYPTHLDYHGSMSAYLDAKWHITQNQTAADYLLLNRDQDVLWERRQQTQATIVPFSLEQPLKNDGVWYNRDDETLYWREEPVLKRSALTLPGDHNVQNALVAIGIAKLLGVSNATIQQATHAFHGIKHRIQYVTTVNGRAFYNDSKATNNEAALTALNSFQTPIVWIAGGLDRHIPLDALKPALGRVKALVAMGETAPQFQALAESAGISQIETAADVEAAVRAAYQLSAPGDTVLLSPACASWDQYENYEVRGDRFIQAVERLSEAEE